MDERELNNVTESRGGGGQPFPEEPVGGAAPDGVTPDCTPGSMPDGLSDGMSLSDDSFDDEPIFDEATMAELWAAYGEASQQEPEPDTVSTAGEIFQVIEWVAEQMPGGFFIYQSDDIGELLYVNTGVLRIFGCSSQEEFRELTGGTFRGMVHPDDFDSVRRSIDTQIANLDNENLDYVEYRIIRRDGSIRRVDDYGHFSWMPGYGEVHYVFLSDATDKYRARRENERRAEVIEGLSVDFNSIFLVDLDRKTLRPYRLNNSLYPEIRGGEADLDAIVENWQEICSRYTEQFVIEPDRERFTEELSADHIRERLQTEASYIVDYRIVNKAGGIRFMQTSVIRIETRGTGGSHAVLGFRDVSAQFMRIQKDTAEKLRMEMELEREKQTRETKSAFLFNISHDIRTPMNAIVGYTDLARRHIGEPERLKDYLDKVHESSFHMMALIEDLLEMSQLDSGRVQLKNTVCNLKEQLEIAVNVLSAQAEEKNLTLTTDFAIPDAPVLLDTLRFRRIMTNLVGNAIKFTPPGGRVTVSAREKQVSESGYARYEFKVSDTGIGMTKEFMARMYRAFEREESSTRSGTRGTGLGLSIVKNLLDVMGGSIAVESRKGAGSTFTVSLPVRLAEGVSELPEEAGEYAARHPGEHRILLVEDIEINRLLAETILEEAGFKVEAVPDGCDAVDAVSEHPLWYYDLVLMDIQMPVMNGYEATRAIRALNREDAHSMPIIALSANAREEDRQKSMESGMNYHIAKPYDAASLIATVNEHLDARKED